MALSIAIAVLLTALQGCSGETSATVSSAWVHEYRCPGAPYDSRANSICKETGKIESGGIFELKFFPAQHSILVHVVVQDPKNTSVDFYEITGCKIWDEDNWDCTENEKYWTTTYTARDGILTHTFISGGSEGAHFPNNYTLHAGHLHAGKASGWKRFWFTQFQTGINHDKLI